MLASQVFHLWDKGRDEDRPCAGCVKEDGYAIVSVLFLVAVLSILCAIILKAELAERVTVLRTIDRVKSQNASDNGIVIALASAETQPTKDSTFSVPFDDGSSVDIDVYPWGLFSGVLSKGISHTSEFIHSALLAASITDSEKDALILGNLQHGLVFAGEARIVGDIAIGPMGASTGSLRNYSAPGSVPIMGKRTTLYAMPPLLDTLALYHEVSLTRTIISRVYRYPTNQDNSGDVMECHGSLDLRAVSNSINYVFCRGSLSIMDTIMRRGPPLYIAVQGAVSFQKNAFLSGPVFIGSTDSIVIPPNISIINSILISEKNIVLLSGSRIIAQLFSPNIHFSSGATASYPSVVASVSFADTTGTIQRIQMDDGTRIEGEVIMHRAASASMDKAVITLSPGATVVGGVYTDAYLTLDGTVDGYVRAFDLYFYDSPTTYLGWMHQGIIDRTQLPPGFLKPSGISNSAALKVLSWM